MRYALALFLLAGAAVPALAAEDTVFTCPAENQLMFRDAATKDLTIALSSDELKLEGAFGEVTMPAQVEEREGMLGARAAGNTTAPMPDKAAVDACIAEEKGKQPNAFEDGRNEFLEQGCKLKATMTEPVPVIMNVELVVIEKPDAMVTITRRYADEEGTAAEIHGVDMIGSCKITGP